MYMDVCVSACLHRGQESVPPELEIQIVLSFMMWMLGT